jgi:hypothetical protein
MTRIELNQWLIDHFSFENYLEIGCHGDDSFAPIRCLRKIGVDPASGGTHRMTSDAFFANNTERFDLVFIDGNHHHDFVFRDITNAVKALTPKGIITLHDCWPPTGDYESLNLCGTGWRALARYRQSPQLDIAVGDFDFGVGLVLQRGNTDPATIQKSLEEMCFADKTPELMRLLSEEELKQFVVWA